MGEQSSFYIGERDCRSKIEAHVCQKRQIDCHKLELWEWDVNTRQMWSKKPHGEEVTLASCGSNELLAHGVPEENTELFFIG